ncbi:hypothetical protein LHP98_17900 [Rhodobacter sp. Har01]|uniref:hypothetical protein n=1 Tax=Rhodobacter sp. Har01 TaxID=2883999 RepID=UPI001D061009|nr:hypothetical protein [Rhodobacter sp. Har01]MCB6179996.1 hypothetical protein [Rhodobacter sp. Har01]
MGKLTVSVDRNADLKALRKLEAAGLVELFGVSIEGIQDTKKLKNQEPPIAVWDSPLGGWDKSVWASDDSKYSEIERIVGRQNHGDCLHLERHIESKRDVFVTDDKHFLSCRHQLSEAFGVTILTVSELTERLAGSASGEGAL